MKIKKINKLFFFKALIVFVGLIFILNKNFDSKKILNIVLLGAADSTDPYEFNSLLNRPLSSSVHLGLFSVYRDGKISPLIVSQWKSTNSDKVWNLKIRNDVTFSDGNIITAVDVKNSIKRIIFLANKNKSKQPLIENILSANKIKKLSDEIDGLNSDKDSVTIILKEPDPLLLEKLAFGFYAVVSPKNYDQTTGAWTRGAEVYSGPYEVIKHDNESYELALRKKYPEDLYAKNAFKKINISWNKNKRETAGLFTGYETEADSYKNFKFYGNTNSFVLYFHLFGWVDPKSVFSKRENRICLREKFYNLLKGGPVQVVKSLYPLILPGVEEVAENYSNVKCEIAPNQKISVRLTKNTQIEKFVAINKALLAALDEFHFNVEKTEFKNGDESQILTGSKGKILSPRIQIAALSTDIGNEDPRYTTKFMLSKDGIYLPDPNGRMAVIVKNPSFSINQINKELFDEGIIWPVFHYSFGFYINQNEIDLDRYSHQWPLAELQWMGSK